MSNKVTVPMLFGGLGTVVMAYVAVETNRDGGYDSHPPPRKYPHILKKMREENPPPVIENLSKRYNRIPFNQTYLAIDYDNLHLYGIK